MPRRDAPSYRLDYEAEANNLTSEEVISEILNKVEVP